ncbi:MAG: HD-GYP domain-containing protein [Clostridia bacterium]|nr:HD-GYP domain-containing protein [Clostridia bacterium]
MRKILIKVSECEPGMIIADSIYNDYGAAIISENTVLDNHLIRKLVNLGISKVKVFQQPQKAIEENTMEGFANQYNDNLEVMKDMMHDISSGKNIDIDVVNKITDSIYVGINENRDILSCINQIRDVDEYTYTHCVNVSLVSMLIGKWLKLNPTKIRLLVQAGLLHDIGKSRVPLEILNKPGPLTEAEYNEIKKHPVHGYRILEKLPYIDKDVCKGVLMHHEREDGSGYPVGLKGTQIVDLAKVISVADIYDAMTSDRVYRVKGTPFKVFELIENNTFGYLDPIVTNAFLKNIAAYYIGDYVRLNTGEIAEVIYINPWHISQPIIKIENAYIDLTVHKEISIAEMV